MICVRIISHLCSTFRFLGSFTTEIIFFLKIKTKKVNGKQYNWKKQNSNFAHRRQTTLLFPPIHSQGPNPLPFLISSPLGIFFIAIATQHEILVAGGRFELPSTDYEPVQLPLLKHPAMIIHINDIHI